MAITRCGMALAAWGPSRRTATPSAPPEAWLLTRAARSRCPTVAARSRISNSRGGRRMKATRAAALGEILRVAATCFGEMGYRATTLDTIAAKAGLSKVTLYRYVRSKDELLSLVFERTIESFRVGLSEIIEQRLPAD